MTTGMLPLQRSVTYYEHPKQQNITEAPNELQLSKTPQQQPDVVVYKRRTVRRGK